MTPSHGRTIPLALALIALTSTASTVRAQGNTFNPYGNSGYADYREFGNPMYSNSPSLPGQARLNEAPIISRPRANSFEQYTNDFEGRGSRLGPGAAPPPRGSSSANAPYFQAYRQYDEQYNRVYRPNDTKADRAFEARLKQRNDTYAKSLDARSKALAEPDPAKRARMLRQIEQDSLVKPGGTARARPTNRVPAPTSRAPSPFGMSTDGRASAAPSPFRTPSRSAAPATRAPTPPRASAGAPRAPAAAAPATDPSTVPVPPPR